MAHVHSLQFAFEAVDSQCWYCIFTDQVLTILSEKNVATDESLHGFYAPLSLCLIVATKCIECDETDRKWTISHLVHLNKIILRPSFLQASQAVPIQPFWPRYITESSLGMLRIPNPHPNSTKSGTFPEIRNPLDTLKSHRNGFKIFLLVQLYNYFRK